MANRIVIIHSISDSKAKRLLCDIMAYKAEGSHTRQRPESHSQATEAHNVTFTHLVTCIPNEKIFAYVQPCRHPDVDLSLIIAVLTASLLV